MNELDVLFGQLFGSMFNTTGSQAIGVLLLMLLLFLGLLYCGLEFDLSLIILSPIPYAFYKGGYSDIWISAMFIIIPLGVGIWSIWVKFSNKQ